MLALIVILAGCGPGDSAVPRSTLAPSPDGSVVLEGACTRGTEPFDASCTRLRVEALDLPFIHAELRIHNRSGARAVLVLGSGTGGGSWVMGESDDTPLADLVDRLGARDVAVVERRWDNELPGGWFSGGDAGIAEHAARYALLARWIRDELGVEALLATGNSGGAVELAYAAGAWDLGSVASLIVPTSGPLDDLNEACGNDSAYDDRCEAWWNTNGGEACSEARACTLTEGAHDLVRIAHGGAPDSDTLQADRPPTPPLGSAPIRVLLGDGDCSAVAPQGAAWADRLVLQGVDASWELVADTRHNVLASEAGVERLRELLRPWTE